MNKATLFKVTFEKISDDLISVHSSDMPKVHLSLGVRDMRETLTAVPTVMEELLRLSRQPGKVYPVESTDPDDHSTWVVIPESEMV